MSSLKKTRTKKERTKVGYLLRAMTSESKSSFPRTFLVPTVTSNTAHIDAEYSSKYPFNPVVQDYRLSSGRFSRFYQVSFGKTQGNNITNSKQPLDAWRLHVQYTVNPVMQDRVTKLSCTVLPLLKYNWRQVKWRRLTCVLEFSPAESLVWCWQPT